MSKIVIGVACHKPFEMPQNNLFLPIAVGAALRDNPIENTQPDDEGDNISTLNPHYCELTAQYWLWKNVEADYYGMCHYRRFLSFADKRFDNFTNDHRKQVLVPEINEHSIEKYHLNDEAGMRAIIENHDVIAPENQDLRQVYTPHGTKSTVYEHFAAHNGDLINLADLDTMISIVHDKYPQYAVDLDEYIAGPYFRGFNCFVMKRELFFELCEYEFDVLSELEKSVDMSTYDFTRSRVYGFMAEIISSSFIYHLEKTGRACVRDVQMLYFQSTDPITPLEPWPDSRAIVFDMTKTDPISLAPTVQSLIEHVDPSKRYDIIVAHEESMASNYLKLYRSMFENCENIRLTFLNWDVKGAAIADDVNAPGVFARALPCCLPWVLDRYDRVTVFRWNLLFFDGWEALLDCDLKSQLIACVKSVERIGANNDIYGETRLFDTTFLGLEDPLEYLNATALTIDMNRMRDRIALSDIALVLGSFNRPLVRDEAVNVVFEHNATIVDQSLCVYRSTDANMAYTLLDLPVSLAREYNEASSCPRIINFDSEDPLWPDPADYLIEYWQLARKTPFYEYLITQLAQFHATHGKRNRGTKSGWRRAFDALAPIGSRRRVLARKALPWDSTITTALRRIVRRN